MQVRLNAYQQAQILTAMPGDVLLALYDGAIRFVAKAEKAIGERDYAQKAEAINRANAILGELSSTLDRKVGPEICGELAALYSYFTDRLNRASFQMEVEPATEVLGHLTRLRATWGQAVHQARQQGHRV